MAKKEFTYRGKTIEELNSMTLEQFAELCTARARKTLANGFDKHILKKMEKARAQGERAKPIKTHKRDIIIIPSMVGLRFAVYRGNSFETLDVTEKMLGHYLGEMVFTRKRLQHGKAGIGATKSSSAVTARG
jgi:small subunit ribosomal protein S19